LIDPTISVRRLTPDDAEAYRAIRLEALQRNPEAFGSTLEAEAVEPTTWFAERLWSSAVFGAVRQPDLLGIAGFYAQTSAKKRHKGVLWGMYVRPSARGTGVARALVGKVIEHARDHVELLQLAVVSTNEQARRLYANSGFSEYGLEPRALKHGGEYFDQVLMVRFL
jgi:ribosomal protein S18 acetylase RimI-like enzyme